MHSDMAGAAGESGVERSPSNCRYVEEGKFELMGSREGQLACPWHVATFANGGFVVVDQGNQRLQVFGPDGKFEHAFGSRGSGEGQFQDPHGVAVSKLGEIVVSDYILNRIQVFARDGRFIRAFGTGLHGQNELFQPTGVAISESGEIFVANTGFYQIDVYASDGTLRRRFGSRGRGEGEFRFIRSLAVSPRDGNIIVTDYEELDSEVPARVLVLSSEGKLVRVLGQGILTDPHGVGVSQSGDIVVADCESNTIVVFDHQGTPVREIGGEKWRQSGQAAQELELDGPCGVAVAMNGKIVVSNCVGNSVQILAPSSA